MTSQPASLVLESFAKVNLFLGVLGKRPDGYHELVTVLQTVDVTDGLEVRRAPELSFTCSESRLPLDDRNLVVRAARLLAAETGQKGRGARIHLEKRIPWGAGLGGGSGNAATALVALNRFWDLGLSLADLEEVGARIGSDVPFFLHGGRAVGWGRGEEIERLGDLEETSLLLLFPPYALATPAVYSAHAAHAARGALATPRLTEFHHETNLEPLMDRDWPDRNDLEKAAESLRPESRQYREALLESGARTARLSGSGSALFGVFDGFDGFDGAERAREAAQSLERRFEGLRCRVTRTVGRQEYQRRALAGAFL